MKSTIRDQAFFFSGIVFYPAAVLLLWLLGKPVRRHLLFVGLFILLMILEIVDQGEKSARDWLMRLIAYSGLFTIPRFILEPTTEPRWPFPISARRRKETQRLFDWMAVLAFFSGVLVIIACPAILSMLMCQTPLLTCDAIKLERLSTTLLPTSLCFWRFVLTALSGVLLIHQIVKAPSRENLQV